MRTTRRLPATAALACCLLAGAADAAGAADPAVPAGPVGGVAAQGLVVDLPVGVPAPPPVKVRSWVVADGTTGEVLAAKNAHLQMPPASTLKTLTALTVFPKLDVNRIYTATSEDANVEGSKAGIVPKGTYSVHQLWQALFLQSGNDAATALANANGGVEPTVAEMNAKAAELGALDTHAVTPTGLDEDGQLSSAYDLALLGRAALRIPELMQYAGTIRAKFPGKPVRTGKKRSTFELWTQQKFVVNYDGAVGIKNGYTTKAGNTLIAAATRGDRTIVVSLMRSQGTAWESAAALSDWAFHNAAKVTPVGTLVEPGTVRAAPGSLAQPGGEATSAPGAIASGPLDGRASPASAGQGAGAKTIAAVLVLTLGGAVVALRARVLLLRRRRRPVTPLRLARR
jgi:D-alanyl-D-alanine carboxypeptidase (penicillin-binding protein 5/6)